MKQAGIIYGGKLERAFAYLLDTILVIVPSLIVANMLQPTGLSVIGAFACNAAYYVGFTASRWQATPAKRLLGLYVIRTDGRPLSYRDATERFLAFLLPNLPMYASFIPEAVAPALTMALCLYWYVPILITPDRAGYHDQLCHTRVVVGRPV